MTTVVTTHTIPDRVIFLVFGVAFPPAQTSFGLILGLTGFCIWPYCQICRKLQPNLAGRLTNIEAGLTSSRHWAIQADY